ncbi:MAG: hypothetical protein GY861_13675 [bacterium]|nr:hypothetical protein [bacterium]
MLSANGLLYGLFSTENADVIDYTFVYFQGDVVAVGRMSTWHGKRVSHLFNVVCVMTMYAMLRPILEENSHQLACAADDIFTLVGRPSKFCFSKLILF